MRKNEETFWVFLFATMVLLAIYCVSHGAWVLANVVSLNYFK